MKTWYSNEPFFLYDLFLILIARLFLGGEKRQGNEKGNLKSSSITVLYEIFIGTWTGQFQCCFALKYFKGKKKGKENTQIMELPCQKWGQWPVQIQISLTMARAEQKTHKVSPTTNHSHHLNLGNHPKAVLFQFPPPLLYKSRYISARQSLIIQGDLSINSSVVLRAEWERDLTSNLIAPHTSSRSFPTVC